MRRNPCAVLAALVLALVGPLALARGSVGAPLQASSGTSLQAFVTGFDWHDNTPPGSADIAYSSRWDPRTLHIEAAGTGTYADPLTMAVGHVKDAAGRSTPDWVPGTRFYLPYLKRYAIVEDLCGDGPTPQNGPCHTGYPAPASTWLDIWVGGRTSTAARSDACMNAITGVHTVVKDPPSTFEVDPGDISAGNGCARQYGDTPQANSPPVSQVAFQANTGNLWATGSLGTEDKRLGMRSATSPSLALVGGGYQTAFQANSGRLWTTGALGTHDLALGMMAGTDPDIAAAPGGYQIAFQANTGRLWTTGALGTRDLGLGMMPGTSPSITAVNGGYQIAFQANTGHLWTTGAQGTRNLGLGMRAGTSPSITTVNGGNGYQVAFSANTGNLWTAGALGTEDRRLGMRSGTSPSIAAVGSGYQVAFQANTTSLWTTGTHGTTDVRLGMRAGTSPAIAAVGSGYQVAFQANTTSLWTTGVLGTRDTRLGMLSETSPGS